MTETTNRMVPSVNGKPSKKPSKVPAAVSRIGKRAADAGFKLLDVASMVLVAVLAGIVAAAPLYVLDVATGLVDMVGWSVAGYAFARIVHDE